MATYKSHLDITYNVGDIVTVDSQWLALNETQLRLDGENNVRMQDVRWVEITPGNWQFRIRFTDGRAFVATGAYPTSATSTAFSTNTGTDQFPNHMYNAILQFRLEWIRVAIEHQITQMDWDFT